MRVHQFAILCIFFILALATRGYSQTADPEVTGRWHGSLSLGDVSLRLVFHFSETNGNLVARLDSPDQRAYGFVADSIELEDGQVRLVFDALGSEFVGMMEESEEAITGIWNQSGQSLPLVLRHR